MHGASWIALFRRIPAAMHDGLALTLNTGLEIMVQRLVKLEGEFVLLRGRLSGSQDNGRLLFLPYDQIVAVSYIRRVSDEEVKTHFAQPICAAVPIASPVAAFAVPTAAPSFAGDFFEGPVQEKAAAAESDEPTLNDADDEGNTPAKVKMPSKTLLLAKLRARLSEGNGSGGAER